MNLDNLTPEQFSNIENPVTQQKFLNELQSFIVNHTYFQNQMGILVNMEQEDNIKISISDLDGDYEQLDITINLIP